MQMKKAESLRRAWGDKPCPHPNLEKEYDLGADTGDEVCTQCGSAFSPGEIETLRNSKRSSLDQS